MNERPLPDEGRISDKLPEAVASPPPNTRTAVAPAAGPPSRPVSMPGPEDWPIPFKFTRGGLLTVGAAFLLSLCLFCYGARSVMSMVMPIPGSEPAKPIVENSSPFLAFLAGGSFLGGALGAVIGKASLDDKGVAPFMGAFVGALAGPLIVLIHLLAFAVFFGGAISV